MSPEAAYALEKPSLTSLSAVLPPVYEVLERVVDLYRPPTLVMNSRGASENSRTSAKASWWAQLGGGQVFQQVGSQRFVLPLAGSCRLLKEVAAFCHVNLGADRYVMTVSIFANASTVFS